MVHASENPSRATRRHVKEKVGVPCLMPMLCVVAQTAREYSRPHAERLVLQGFCGRVAGGLGFEPRLAESESAVLPLNYPPPGRSPRWSKPCGVGKFGRISARSFACPAPFRRSPQSLTRWRAGASGPGMGNVCRGWKDPLRRELFSTPRDSAPDARHSPISGWR